MEKLSVNLGCYGGDIYEKNYSFAQLLHLKTSETSISSPLEIYSRDSNLSFPKGRITWKIQRFLYRDHF